MVGLPGSVDASAVPPHVVDVHVPPGRSTAGYESVEVDGCPESHELLAGAPAGVVDRSSHDADAPHDRGAGRGADRSDPVGSVRTSVVDDDDDATPPDLRQIYRRSSLPLTTLS